MDFHSMKRKELQALCKKHNIPANLTNLDMANKLSSLLKEKEKPITRGRSCLKDGEIASVNVSDETRKIKKVRFSPENEMIEFVDLEADPREARLVARRRSMGRAVTKKIKDLVIENVDSNDNIVDNTVRNMRSRAQKIAEEVVRSVPMLPIEKKRARRGGGGHALAAKDVDRNVMDLSGNIALENAAVEETGVPVRRSLRNREVVGENEKDGEILGLQVLRKKNAEGTKKISENNGLAADGKIIQPEKPLTRSKRNVMKVEGSEQLNGELGQNEMVRKGRITRSRTQRGMEETVVEVQGVSEMVLQLEEPSMHPGRNGNRRKSVRAMEETEVEVQGESEMVLQLEEPSMHPGRNGNRRQSVMHRNEKVVPEGPVAENENRKVSRSSSSGGGSTVEIPKENEKDSLPGGPLRRSRRNASSAPFVEHARRLRQNGSRHESVAVSDALDGITNAIVKNKQRKRRRDPILEEENVVTDFAPLIEESPRRSKGNAVKSNLVMQEVVTGKVVGKKKAKGRSKTPIVEVEAPPLTESTSVIEEPPLVDAQLAMGDVVESATDPVSSSHKQSSKDTTEKKSSTKKVVCPGTSNLEKARDFIMVNSFGTPASESAEMRSDYSHKEEESFVSKAVAVTEKVNISFGVEEGDPASQSLERNGKFHCNDIVEPQPEVVLNLVNGVASAQTKQAADGYSPAPLCKNISTFKQLPIANARLSEQEVPESASSPLSSSNEVLNDTNKKRKGSTRESSLKKQLGSNEVCTRSPHLEGVRDPSVVKPEGTAASNSMKLQSEAEQEMNDSVGEFLGVAEKENITVVVGNENMLHTDIHKDNEYDLASQSQNISEDFNCTTLFDLQSASEKAIEINVLDLSDGGRVTPNMVGDNVEYGLLETMSVSHVMPAENVAEVQLTNGYFSPGNPSCKSIVAPEYQACCIGDEVTHSSGDVLSINNDAQNQDETRAKIQSNVQTIMPAGKINHFEVEENSNHGNEFFGETLCKADTFVSNVGDDMCSQERIEDFSTDMENKPEEASYLKRAMQDVDKEISYEGLEGNLFMDEICSQEAIEESSTEMENKFEEASHVKEALQDVDRETCEELEGNPSMYDNPISISNELDGQLAKEKENEGLERNCVHVSEEIREGSTWQFTDGERISLIISEETEADKKEHTLTPIVTPKCENSGNDGSMSSYDRIPLKDDGSKEDHGLKHLFATPANDRNSNEEDSSHETGTVDVMMPKDLPREVVGTRKSEHEKSASKSKALPTADEEIDEAEEIREGSTREFTDGERISLIISEERDTDKKEHTVTPIVTPEYSGNDGSMSSYDRIPLKDDGSKEDHGLKHLFATPANDRNSNEEASNHETGAVDVMMPKSLPRDVVGTMESEHEKLASKSNALPTADEEFIDEVEEIREGSTREFTGGEGMSLVISEERDTSKKEHTLTPIVTSECENSGNDGSMSSYDLIPLKDDGSKEDHGLKHLFATPANDRNSNEEASNHETGTVDVMKPKGLLREVVGTMESEHTLTPIVTPEYSGNDRSMSFYDRTPLMDDGSKEDHGLKHLFATPANDRNSNEEASNHETGTVDVMMPKGLPREVVGTMESEHEKSASKSNALPTADEEFIDEGSNEKADIEFTCFDGSSYTALDGNICKDGCFVEDKESEGSRPICENYLGESTCLNALELSVGVEIPPLTSKERDARKIENFEVAAERTIFVAECNVVGAYADAKHSEAITLFTPNYVSEYQASGTSNKEMLSIKRSLSTDDDMQDQDVPSNKYTTGTKAKDAAKGMEGDSDFQCDDEEENADFLPEVASSEPCDSEDGFAQVRGSSGASLVETMFTENEASEEKLTTDLSKSRSKCFEGTTMRKEEDNEETMSSFGRLGHGKVAIDHADEFAKWNTNSPCASDEVSEKITKEKLILADAEADLDYNDSEGGVSMVVKNRNNPEPDAVECGEVDIFNDEMVSALDKSSPASVKPTDRKGDIGLEISNKFVETAPQIDEVKLGDCSGHRMERVQELVKSEHGEDSLELSVDDVTGTMLQVDEVKHGDLDSQKDVATMEGSLNVKDKNSDAVKKTDVPNRFFDLNLEHQKVSNSSNFSTNVSNSDGEKYDSHLFEEHTSIAEGKKINEVVLEDQFNDAHGFAVSPIASIEFDEDKVNSHNTPTVMDEKDIDSMRANNVSDDAKDVSHIEDDVRSSLDASKEHLVNDEDALVDDASLGGFGCLTPNKLLCGDGSKSIAKETSGSLHNTVDMVLCAGDSNESAEAQNFNDTSVSPPAGNVDSAATPSFKFSANHGTTERGASGFNVESCLLSSWEMNLFSGDDDVFAVDKLYGGTSETNYSENSTEVKSITCDAEEHHMEKKVEKLNGSLLAPFNEPIYKDEVSKELKDVVVTMKANHYSEYSEQEVEFEKSSVPIHDMILTDTAKMNGCEHAEPRAEGDSRYSVVENTVNTDVVDAISIYLLEEEKCGERGEEIEPSEDVLKSNSRMVDQAVDGGFAAEDAQMWQPKSESAQRKNSVAEKEKDNNLFAKQLNSTAKKMKDARVSLIQGTPKKLFTALDMKENAPSIKRQHMGNVTMVKSVTKRRALEDLQRK